MNKEELNELTKITSDLNNKERLLVLETKINFLIRGFYNHLHDHKLHTRWLIGCLAVAIITICSVIVKVILTKI